MYLRIAVPTPLRQSFDYLPPLNCNIQTLKPGIRVKVPFGSRTLIGVLIKVVNETNIQSQKLKHVLDILDTEPPLVPMILELAIWASEYYQHPIGEVISTVLPTALRKGKSEVIKEQKYWCITEQGKDIDLSSLTQSPRQAVALRQFRLHSKPMSEEDLKIAKISKTVISRIQEKGWIEECESPHFVQPNKYKSVPLSLNEEQQYAVETVLNNKLCGRYLLAGVTGSGKTEVYLQIIAEKLKQGQQALVIVPEIALTPQTLSRFEQRFNEMIVVFHSQLSEQQRLTNWILAKRGAAKIVIGTRSAIFTPLKNPGIIIVDEEHDISFKQQDGFKYSARDVGVMRAQNEGISIILGSATPSLESFKNAIEKNYELLTLTKRAGEARSPTYRIIDLRQTKTRAGLAVELIHQIERHINNGKQVLVFHNRRGYAPILLCKSCDWIACCRHCDARLTLHDESQTLRCHHCGYQRRVDQICPECGSKELHSLGYGTERLEKAFMQYFPDVNLIRIDRDSTSKKGRLQDLLSKIRQGRGQILIGTQMLAKGHHFPNVTLVIVLNADQSLLSSDFRGAERFGQLLMQVGGRAGRASNPGEVVIQTYHPEHPALQQLLKSGYFEFAKYLLKERKESGLPPFSHYVMIRAESVKENAAMKLLQQARLSFSSNGAKNFHVYGPIPALMERRLGRYRAQLLLQSTSRKILQQTLPNFIRHLDLLNKKHRLRWAVDVDPYEVV